MKMRLLAVVAVVAALTLSGCAASVDDYPAKAARTLQSQVLAVSQSSADGDMAGSLTRLDELVVSLNDSLARGEITGKRYASISSAIALVRADLDAAVAAQQNQPSAPAKNNGPGKKDKPPGKNKND